MMPRRPWFRFSLRTFFVLLTLFGMWLGVQWKWIRDRADYIKAHPRAVGVPWKRDKLASAPGLLWLFGHQGVTRLEVYIPDFSERAKKAKGYPAHPEVLEARRLFPEAIIWVVEPSEYGDGYTGILWSTWPPGEAWEYPLRGQRAAKRALQPIPITPKDPFG